MNQTAQIAEYEDITVRIESPQTVEELRAMLADLPGEMQIYGPGL